MACQLSLISLFRLYFKHIFRLRGAIKMSQILQKLHLIYHAITRHSAGGEKTSFQLQPHHDIMNINWDIKQELEKLCKFQSLWLLLQNWKKRKLLKFFFRLIKLLSASLEETFQGQLWILSFLKGVFFIWMKLT